MEPNQNPPSEREWTVEEREEFFASVDAITGLPWHVMPGRAGIYVTHIVPPEQGWPVAFHCPLCKETTFMLSPWAKKPDDGDYFRIDKSCMSDEFFNRHNMIMAMEGLDRLVRSRNGLSPEDRTNGT